MISRFRKLAFTGICLSAIALVGPAVTETETKPVWTHEDSDIPADPNVVFGQLENGMRYAILANQTPKRTAAIRMSIGYGSLSETEDERGLFHFLEHMAFNGSKNVPEGEMIKILERLGLAFGPDTNAYTSFDEVQYQLDLPDVTDELIDTGLFLMRETASELSLSPGAIDRERGVILSEKRARDSIGLRQYEAFNQFFAPNAKLTDRLPIGTAEVIKTATPATFENIYKTYYRPETTFLVFVGDIDATDIEGRIQTVFSDWSGTGQVPNDPDMGSIDFDRPTQVGSFIDPDIQPSVSLMFPLPYQELPDTAANRIEDLKRSIALGIINRRFATKARGESAPYLAAGAGWSSIDEVTSYYSIRANALPGQWDKALIELEQEFRRARVHGFTEAEVAEQLANIEASQVAAAERSKTRSTASLASQLSSSIQSDRVFGTPEASLERFIAQRDTITPESVRESLDDFFDAAAPQIFVTLPEDVENLENIALETFATSTKTPVMDETRAEAVEFAYTDFGPAGKIVSDSVLDPYDIRTIKFANNVRLNLKQTDFQDKAILISLRVGGGTLEIPQDPDGLVIFASAAFNQGGLEAHSVDDLRSLLAGKFVSSNLGVGTTALTGRSSTQADDVLTQMQVWAARLTAPGYREEGERLWQRQIDTIYEQLDATPAAILRNKVSRFLRSDHKHFGLPEKDALLTLDYATLKPELTRMLETGAIEIGVVGDFEADAVIAAVAETFGALPTREAEQIDLSDAKSSLNFTSARGVQTFTHAGEADKSLIQIAWPVPDGSDQRLRAEMNLMMEVFNLKLTDTLREELGATYSPSTGLSMSEVYKGFGFASATADIAPEDMEKVTDVILTVAATMADGDISEDELDRARKPIVERFDESLESNRFWLNFVDEAQSSPEDLDLIEDRQAFYGEATPERLIELSKSWLNRSDAVIIQILSEKFQPDLDEGN